MALREKKAIKKEKRLSGMVPRLDLSKVKNESDDESSEEEGFQDKLMDGETVINN